ncbi:MAG: DUF1493 family protein [Ferruginibacter sp.]
MSTQYSITDIQQFIATQLRCDLALVTEEADIIYDLNCVNLSLDEFIAAYRMKFDVNMEDYRWYFHTNVVSGDTSTIGKILFKTPPNAVKHIPITPKVLWESANQGKWLIWYPEHTVPRRRFDAYIQLSILFIFIIAVLYTCMAWR